MMRGYKIMLALFVTVIATISLYAIVPPLAQSQKDEPQAKPKKYTRENFDKEEFANQFPIVGYDEPEPTDPEQRARRKATGDRYNNRHMVASPADSWRSTGAERIDDWDLNLSALPVAESDLIVVGRVSDAQAHLSTDKGGVYSEFTTQVDDVLKSGNSQVQAGSTILVDREGGRVRYASGKTALFHVSGMGMPRVGHRYVLFLKGHGEERGYSIVTGYELHGGRVYPLDKRDSESKHFDAYWDMEETTFERTVRDEVARKRQARQEGGPRQ